MLVTKIPFVAEVLTVLATQLAIPIIFLQILISSVFSILATVTFLFITTLCLNFFKNRKKNKNVRIDQPVFQDNGKPYFQKLLDLGSSKGGCNELIVYVLGFLHPTDILTFAATCKTASEIVDKQETIWKEYLKYTGWKITSLSRL
jgi:hypothetical protein